MSFRRELVWFLVFGTLSLLLHASSFAVPHEEGDEIVYLTLAREMNWDLTHYTTRDSVVAQLFPSAGYRNAVFHHPPLYPLLLKAGGWIGDPVLWGLAFQSLACLLLLWFLIRFARFARLSESATLVLLTLAVSCPLLLFSTTRIHLDGLFAIFLFCGLSLLVEAQCRRSAAQAFLAGAFLAVAFNTRFTALAMLPLVLLVLGLGWRLLPPHPVAGTMVASPWKVAASVLAPLLLVGGSHYLRILLEYHTLLPGSFLEAGQEPERFTSPMLASVARRSRIDVLAYLIAAVPVLGVLAAPSCHRAAAAAWRRRSWEVVYFVAAVYCLAVNFVADYSFRQLRFYCSMTPFLYANAALLWDRAEGAGRQRLAFLVGLGLLLMVTTGFLNTAVDPGNARLDPSLFLYVPLLARYYH